jgi:large subunit ribosomal protein L25
VDFLVVNLREEMTVSVPIVLVGESPMVEKREGLLLHQTEHVLLRALPMNIPPIVEVDISSLDAMDKAIHVSDLELPENVTLLTPEDELVAKITELPIIPVEEVEEEEAEVAEEAAVLEAEAGLQNLEAAETEEES